MSRIRGLKPSPAMVVAVVAVVLSLGGVGVAAVGHLKKNDVKHRHIAKGAVRSSELANGAVRDADLAPATAAGVQTGVVDAAGTSTSNPAVTVSKNGTGRYVLNFAAGTWSREGRPLVLHVTPFGISGAVVTPVVEGGQRRSDGSATFDVTLSSTTPALTPHDNQFMFIAATSGG